MLYHSSSVGVSVNPLLWYGVLLRVCFPKARIRNLDCVEFFCTKRYTRRRRNIHLSEVRCPCLSPSHLALDAAKSRQSAHMTDYYTRRYRGMCSFTLTECRCIHILVRQAVCHPRALLTFQFAADRIFHPAWGKSLPHSVRRMH